MKIDLERAGLVFSGMLVGLTIAVAAIGYSPFASRFNATNNSQQHIINDSDSDNELELPTANIVCYQAGKEILRTRGQLLVSEAGWQIYEENGTEILVKSNCVARYVQKWNE